MDLKVLNIYPQMRDQDIFATQSKETKSSIKYISDLISCGMFVKREKMRVESSFDQILKSSVSQLILIVTEKCNMRCTYCIFGEEYKGVKSYSEEDMTKEIAVNAIDMFIELHKEKEMNGCRALPIISFYGGEPLVNYELINYVVNYCKTNGYQVAFSMTTNGTLLSDDIIDFLVKNNFSVTVSLDGGRDETNRKRIFINGFGAFDIVMANSLKLHKRFKEKDNNKPILFNACHDFKTNLSEVIEYFNNYFYSENLFVTVNQISPSYTDYYDGFTIEDKNNFEKNKNELVKKYFNEQIKGEKNSFRNYGLFSHYKMLKDRIMNTGEPLSLPCVIGAKMAVSANGSIFICERVNQQVPIGNVESGLDYSRIDKIIKEYQRIREENCSKCNLSRLCDICYSQMIDENKMQFNFTFCEAKKKAIKNQLRQMYSVLEINENSFSE